MKEIQEPEKKQFIFTSGDEASVKEQKLKEQERSRLKNWKEEVEIPLSDADMSRIQDKVSKSESDIEKSLQEVVITTRGIYISLIVSFLFIALSLQISDVQAINMMTALAQATYESIPWDSSQTRYMASVSSVKDLEQYIRNVYIPLTFTQQGENFTTYLVGSRMTLNQYYQVPDPVADYRIPSGNDIDNYIDSGEENTNRIGAWEYQSSNGYDGEGGYIEYFIGDNEATALEQWRIMQDVWLSRQFKSLTVETIIHNRNMESSLLYTQVFQKEMAGPIVPSSFSSGVLIEVYEDSTSSRFISVIILLFFYILGLLVQIIKMVQTLTKVSKTFFAKLKLDLEWFEYLEIINISMTICTVIIFSNLVFSNIGKYQLPLTTQQELTDFINYFYKFLALTRINAVSCLLIMIKVTIVLKNRFPSFGALFDTIQRAKNDIINFAVIAVVILLGFVFMGSVAFGPGHSMFQTVQGGFTALFITILSDVGYSELQNANVELATIFTVCYCILFYAILLNMFTAIVISTYITLREQNQLMLEAKAQMASSKTKKFVITLVNFVFFRFEDSMAKDAEEYLKLNAIKEDDTENHGENFERIKMLEISILQQYHRDYYKIFKYNLGQIRQLLQQESVKTNEQVKNQLKETIRTILVAKRKTEIRKKDLENNKFYNFAMVQEMGIYLVYLILLMVAIVYRLQTSNVNELYKVVNKIVQTNELSEIIMENEIYHYLYYTLGPALVATSSYDFNFIVREPLVRLTINKFVLIPNTSRFSQNVIKEYVPVTNNIFTGDFRGQATNILYTYISPGDWDSFANAGGYQMLINSDTDSRNVLYQFVEDRLCSLKMQSVVVEFVLYNNNFDAYSYCNIQFLNDLGGHIKVLVTSTPVYLYLYSGSINYIEVLEILVAGLTLYFIYKEIRSWLWFWKITRKNRKRKRKGEKAIAKVIRILEPRKDYRGCKQIFFQFTYICKRFFNFLIDFLIQVFLTTLTYVTSGVYTIVNLSGNALTLLLLSQVVILRNNAFVNTYETSTSTLPNFIAEFYQLTLIINNYRTISAFLAFVSFVRMLQFYTFSKDLSVLTDVLNAAKIDLLFFIAILITILFGYSLMAYLLLGHSMSGFSSVTNSIVGCYMILLGNFDLSAISSADNVLGLLFFGTFIILFYLLLLNMFTGIIAAHYRQIKREDHTTHHTGFFQKIWNVIRAVICETRYELELKKGEEVRMRNKQVKIVDVYANSLQENRVEVIKIEMNQNTALKTSPEMWYSILDHALIERSMGGLSLSDMVKAGERADTITRHAKFADVVYITVEQWKLESTEDKVMIWRTLSSLQRDHIEQEIEKAILLQEELPSTTFISEIHKKLWENTPIEEKISMWVGVHHFNDFERVCIWNSLSFLPSSFGLTAEEMQKYPNWDSSAEQSYWSSLSFKDKYLAAENILKPMRKYRTKLKKIKKLEKKIEFLKSEAFTEFGFKEFLWFSMNIYDDWKLRLFMNNSDSVQAEIIAVLISSERKNSVFALDTTDQAMSELLNHGYYDHLVSVCTFNAETVKNRTEHDIIEATQSEISHLNAFKTMLKEKLSIIKAQNVHLKDQYLDIASRSNIDP